MVTGVQNWLDDPTTNAGWMMLTDEVDITAKRFDSRENATEANRPRLVVEYEFTSVAQAAAAVKSEGVKSSTTRDLAFAEPNVIPGDADRDGEVGFRDFILLATNFGKTDAAFADGDFGGDGIVDFTDFVVLAQNFGRQAIS